MKIVNVVKLKEEFDYESLCRKLETHVDHLIAEVDKQQKLRENYKTEMERKLREYETSYAETEKRLVSRSEVFICPFVFAFPIPYLCNSGIVHPVKELAIIVHEG